MPDIVVHAAFGKEVRQALPEEIRSRLSDAPYTFALFGPDLWFLHRPWKRREGRGRMMHTTRPGAFLMALADRVRRSDAPEELFSYLAGFLCHYALDSVTHPYIIHITEEKHRFPRSHMSFEHELDLEELRRAGLDRRRHAITENYFPRCRLPESIREDIDAVFRSVYGWEGCWSALNRAAGRHHLVYRIIENPAGLFSRLARLTRHPQLKAFSYSESRFSGFDVENNRREEWTRSHEPDVSSAATFGELRAEALRQALRMIESAWRCLFLSEISREELAGIIGNRSYLSGLDAGDPRNLRFPSLLPPQKSMPSAGGDPE